MSQPTVCPTSSFRVIAISHKAGSTNIKMKLGIHVGNHYGWGQLLLVLVLGPFGPRIQSALQFSDRLHMIHFGDQASFAPSGPPGAALSCLHRVTMTLREWQLKTASCLQASRYILPGLYSQAPRGTVRLFSWALGL